MNKHNNMMSNNKGQPSPLLSRFVIRSPTESWNPTILSHIILQRYGTSRIWTT